MRILLAVDGSVSSDHATQLINSLSLPEGSVIRVVAVQASTIDAMGMTWLGAGDEGVVPDLDQTINATHFRDAVANAERALAGPGRTVDGFILKGRSGSQIVDEAKAFNADLVVVGSRGHGTIATMVLGSTASEVVDHAPCPVLVASGDRLGRGQPSRRMCWPRSPVTSARAARGSCS
ncbi:MAG: universal stress protein [Chloroflexi bacterium]|nr:MAG: universal stress protein [Chloroflexota bacterium]